GGGIGMRLGEAKIAAQGSRRSHTNIGDLRFEFREYRLLFSHLRRSLDRSMRARRADFDCAVTTLDRVQSGNHLEIDQIAITKSPMPHSQQQFSPAGVNGRLI